MQQEWLMNSNLCNRNRNSMPLSHAIQPFPNSELTRNLGNNEVNLPPHKVIGFPNHQIKEQHPTYNRVIKEQRMKICHVEKQQITEIEA